MRTAIFDVPEEHMTNFAEEITARRLTNTITGVTRDGEIEIEVRYSRDEEGEVNELEEILDNLFDGEEEEDQQ